MDLTSMLGSLLGSDSLTSIGSASKTSASDVASVLTVALPTLLAGASAQATNEKTAESFANALNTHSADTSNVSSLVGSIDVKDGKKVVQHLLGDETATATDAIAQATGVSKAKTSTILAIVAPLLLSLLSNNNTNNTTASTTNLLTSLLGGTSTNNATASTLGALTSLLGGASAPASTGSVAGNLLGSLLGGGAAAAPAANTAAPAANLLGSLLGASAAPAAQPVQPASNGVDLTSAASLLGSLLSSGATGNAAAPAQTEANNAGNSLLGGLLGLLK